MEEGSNRAFGAGVAEGLAKKGLALFPFEKKDGWKARAGIEPPPLRIILAIYACSSCTAPCWIVCVSSWASSVFPSLLSGLYFPWLK